MAMVISFVPRFKVPGISMFRAPYCEDALKFIEDNYQHMSDAEMGEELGRTSHSIKTQRQKMGLYNYHHCDVDWTDEELDLIRTHYPDMENKALLKLLPGRNVQGLYKKAYELGVKKSPEFMLEQNRRLGAKLGDLGKGHRFKKGHVPMNKGMKMEEYMSAEAIERTKATRFKKGNVPHNTLWNGAITIRKDSGGQHYVWIRLAKAEWQEYHRYQWEKHYGPIPEDHLVTFKDGNSLNCTPENLQLVTRIEHLDRNTADGKASQKLTDPMVAYYLSGGDMDLKEHILAHEPELIRVARANYKLKRAINNECKED